MRFSGFAGRGIPLLKEGDSKTEKVQEKW